jgi:hypothetical protein
LQEGRKEGRKEEKAERKQASRSALAKPSTIKTRSRKKEREKGKAGWGESRQLTRILLQTPTDAKKVSSNAVDSGFLDGLERIGDVSSGFRHLAVALGPVRVHEERLGRRQTVGEEEGWPVNRVKAGRSREKEQGRSKGRRRIGQRREQEEEGRKEVGLGVRGGGTDRMMSLPITCTSAGHPTTFPSPPCPPPPFSRVFGYPRTVR